MTLHGEQKETQKDVNAIHRQLRIMLANSLAVVGLSWGLDRKRNGTEPILINQTEIGTELQTYSDKPDGSWGSNGRNNDDQATFRIRSPDISCLQCL